jgi:site-specific recombinase XerD
MTIEIAPAPSRECAPGALFAPTAKVARRVVEFFTAHINNEHTRKAYLNATRRFSAWCDRHGIRQLEAVQAFHVAAYVRTMQREYAPPTVKQNLAAIRMLFDALVSGGVLDVNPAHAVRGPKYTMKKGKTPVLTGDEARDLIESIDTGCVMGLRDRALIALMVYTFARVGAALRMKVADYFVQGRRGWVRLHEKGGKEHEVPCHHKLEEYLDDYIAAAAIASDPDGPLFRTSRGKTRRLTRNPMWQQDAFRMIRRRARAAGIETAIGNHTFPATGITAYLRAGGSLEVPSRSRTMNRRGRRSSTTGAATRFHWMRWNG